MNKIETFTELLRDNPPEIYCEPFETNKIVKHTIGGLTLEFVLEYEAHIINHIPASEFNPQECDFEFENKEHSEIALYRGAEFIELTNNELHIIDCILYEHLY
jgi:hypothetical protein